MSLNNSVLLPEQPEDVGEVTDLYSRELNRKKSSSAQPFYTEDRDSRENTGGYRDWKAKNGMDSSDRMLSSLGRALHNQGMVSQSENYSSPHYHDPHSEHRGRDQHTARHNSSEPYYSSQNVMGRHNSSEVMFRHNNQPMIRCEVNGRLDGQNNQPMNVNGHVNERKYQLPSRENGEECISADHIEVKCSGPCCSAQNVQNSNSLMISPNHQNMGYRDVYHGMANLNSPHVEHSYQNPEPLREQRINHNFSHNQSPRQSDPHGAPPCQLYIPCHPPPPPKCHCQNPVQTPHRPDSPRKKSDSSKRTEASIKKLYRILWLQNEQLGLLERQVSKLIELNFAKDCSEKPMEAAVDKASAQVVQITKLETKEIGIMADLPCPQCISKTDKSCSSDSEPEVAKKSVMEESLTLNGVEIPVNGAEINSPPVSMHIDLHDYQDTSSSSLSNESDTSENESEPVGWTFYDNVVGQVNNILKTTGTKKKSHRKKKQAFAEDINKAVHQLKLLGLAQTDSDSNNPKRVTFEKGLKEQQVNLRAQSEVSMNFNALASKYLNSAGGTKAQDISLCNVISSNTNMSIATMRYLERHQISNRDAIDVFSKKNSAMRSRKSRPNTDNPVTSKFLDITAIRQQPKLLPKNL